MVPGEDDVLVGFGDGGVGVTERVGLGEETGGVVADCVVEGRVEEGRGVVADGLGVAERVGAGDLIEVGVGFGEGFGVGFGVGRVLAVGVGRVLGLVVGLGVGVEVAFEVGFGVDLGVGFGVACAALFDPAFAFGRPFVVGSALGFASSSLRPMTAPNDSQNGVFMVLAPSYRRFEFPVGNQPAGV